jgi:Na+/H+-dicarboxylate symporter
MCRNVINVIGDASCVVVMTSTEGQQQEHLANLIRIQIWL